MNLRIHRVITATSGRESLVLVDQSSGVEATVPATREQAERAREMLRQRDMSAVATLVVEGLGSKG